ncbi:glycosyl hydrolase [Aspergillus alliaceus]|uniref:Glycosyl hydrolase n=1 Tax=Petromyces alliaceus TaxID=209559 RepID=A0A5N7C1G7_PETAA|nr:glycosyl hydrolase [Aspergillus alliaceus]
MSVLTQSSQLAELGVIGAPRTFDHVKARGSDQKQSHPGVSDWTPSFHIKAPQGWLNDPCGLGYDPSTGLYHIAFQWNPKGNDWGNISWGYATSKDFVTWKLSPSPCLVPSTVYDQCGIFTGCLRATDPHGKPGALTHIYTSVSHLPIHYTLPYVKGCESLSIAVSRDGVTWERQNCNPILPGPPSNVDVTGWRDPYVGTWAAMQTKDGVAPSQIYGFLSGGIKNRTPTVFAYAVDPNDLREWKYIGHLADVGLNFYPSRWSGDFGVNWEVASVLTLSDDQGVSRDFAIMGSEGCVHFDDIPRQTGRKMAIDKRTSRQQLWMSLTLRPKMEMQDESEALAKYSFAGVFDHGCFYAANAFFDPNTSLNTVFGWITEEDLPDHLRHVQGWSGMLSTPRVVRMMTLGNVIRARHSDLKAITSIEAELNTKGSYTVRTLGVQPDQRLMKLRNKARNTEIRDLKLYHDATVPLQTSKWEVKAELAVNQQCTRVGFAVAHNADFSSETIISWEVPSETFTVERPTPYDSKINHGLEAAPHTLFTISDEHSNEMEEPLRIHAIFDMSVLEVFVNERTAISTRVYTPVNRCFGVRFLAKADQASGSSFNDDPAAVLLHANVWDGLGA